VVFDARERAYASTRAGRPPFGGRVAVWLAWDAWAFRGEHAVSSGWLQRARSLLDRSPRLSRAGLLELREARVCLLEDGDPDRAHTLAAEGIRIARASGSIDLEMLGHAVQGLALVASGAVSEGMRALDEVNAAILAGE
jgi:hypothetical protein